MLINDDLQLTIAVCLFLFSVSTSISAGLRDSLPKRGMNLFEFLCGLIILICSVMILY